MVSLLVHVPRSRVPKHPRWSREDTTKPAPHSPHFVRPEKRNFGRTNWLKRFPGCANFHYRRTPRYRVWTACHNSSPMMRSAGTSLTTHSDSGFGRETRFPVSGSFRYRSLFQTMRPIYSSL